MYTNMLFIEKYHLKCLKPIRGLSMNKSLSILATVLISVILVILIFQTLILGQHSMFNYLAIVAFLIFLFISVYDMRNADEED